MGRKYLCSFPGCQTLLDNAGYCDKHKQAAESKRNGRPFENAVRSNEDFYHTSRWQKLRKKIIEKYNSICQRCGTKTDAPEIHHITPPRGNEELFFSEDNLVVICPSCHKIITEWEIKQRNNKKIETITEKNERL